MKFTLAILFLLQSFSAHGFSIPPVPRQYVNDYASVLSPAVRQDLENRLAQFEKETSNQVLVVTLPDLGGEEIEEVSIRLAEKWKPGQKGRDNGAILILSKKDRKVRIETGYGLEGVLTDALSRSILANEIIPRFKQGDFDGGVVAGTEAILKATRGEYQGQRAGEGRGGSFWIFLILILVFFVLLPMLRRSRSLGLSHGGTSRGGWWGGGSGGWGRSGGGGFSGGGGSFGGGGSSGGW